MFDPQKTLIAVAAGVAFLATAGLASAASITNVEYSNGDVTIQGNAGQSVNGKVRVVVPNNQEVEFVEFDVISDSLAPVCVDTGRLQEGTHWISIPGDVKFPPNTGTYSLNVTTHGIFGGLAADDCEGDQNGSNSFGSSVRTVGGSASSGQVGTVDSLMSLIASLQAQMGCMVSGGVWDGVAKACGAKPAPAGKCAELATKAGGRSQGSQDPAGSLGVVGMLQSYLMTNGFDIPLLRENKASYGYWGPQTQNAYSNFKTANACL